MTLGALLPLVVVLGVVFVLGARTPSSSPAAARVDLPRDLAAAVVLAAAMPGLALAARWLATVQCPGGLDATGACPETSALDLTAVGIIGGSLAVAVAVAWLMGARAPGNSGPQMVAPVGSRAFAGVASSPTTDSRSASGSPSGPGAAPADSAPEAMAERVAADPPDQAAPPEETSSPDSPDSGSEQALAGSIDGQPTELEALIHAAAEALRQRPGLVFSGHSNDDALDALDQMATALDGQRYLERHDGAGDAAHNGASAKRIAGPNAGHTGELALEIAGGAVRGVLFCDGQLPLSPLAVGRLKDIGSVCLSATDDGLASACKVVIRVGAWEREPGRWTDPSGNPQHGEPTSKHPTRAQVITRIRERATALSGS
jgi:hypothetical protein